MTVHAVSSNGSKSNKSNKSTEPKSAPDASAVVAANADAGAAVSETTPEAPKVNVKEQFLALDALLHEETALENRKQEILAKIFSVGKRGPYKFKGILFTVWERKGKFSLSEHKAGEPVDVG